MKRAALAGVALASLALACTEKGRSVVLVDVTVAGSLPAAPSVSVYVTQGGQVVGHADGGALPQKLGVYLPKTVSGAVGIVACGFDGNQVLGSGMPTPPTVTITPGESSGPFMVPLTAGAASQFCTRGGTGGQGGGGGSTGGRGGSGGGTGGVSGTGGGTAGIGGGGTGGGLAGQSGTGGGLAGQSGTGGALAGRGGTGGAGGALGGRGGSAGGGGTTGTAGGGGTGGSVAGTGGGTAGTGGGTAGTGGTGPRWNGARPVANDSSAVERLPSVAVDFNGNAMAVFERDGNIFYSRYTFGSDSWSAPMMLATGMLGSPTVVVDGRPYYLAVWYGKGNDLGVWWSIFQGTSWSTPMRLTTNDGYPPVAAVNTNGMAIVAWSEKTGGTGNDNNDQRVAASIRDANGNWSSPHVMRAGLDVSDRKPAVAISSVNQAFVVWEQVDPNAAGGWNSVFVDQYSGTTWTAATPLETYDMQASYSPSIAVNVQGVAVATYLQVTPSNGSVQLLSARNAGSGFGGLVVVRDTYDIDATQPPSVHLDDNGVATYAWTAVNSQGRGTVELARMTATDLVTPIPTAEPTTNYAGIDSNGGVQAPLPIVRGDGTGNVIVVWRKRAMGSTRFDLFARRSTGAVWGIEMPIETMDMVGSNVVNVFFPALSMNGSGVAVAAWYYTNNSGTIPIDVYANVFR